MPCPATRQQEARAIVRTAAPIASAAAFPAQPLAACPLRVASALQVGNDCSTFCAASPPSLSLRGGRRPTWQSRSIRLDRGKAIGEIVTAFPRLPRPLRGLAMTNLRALYVRHECLHICDCQWRSLSAATDAIGPCVLSTPCTDCKCLPEIATGAKRPRNDKSGAVTILTAACTGCKCVAGRGMPLPYNARLPARQNRLTPQTGSYAHNSSRRRGSRWGTGA